MHRSSISASSSIWVSGFRNRLEQRRAELERAAAGLPTEQKAARFRTVNDVVDPYLTSYKLSHRPKSVLFANGRLAHVKKALANVVLSDLTDERIREYMRQRQGEKVSGRTINMEVGELSRAIGQPWSLLWPKVSKLEERKDVGRANRNENGRGVVPQMGASRPDGQGLQGWPREECQRLGPHHPD